MTYQEERVCCGRAERLLCRTRRVLRTYRVLCAGFRGAGYRRAIKVQSQCSTGCPARARERETLVGVNVQRGLNIAGNMIALRRSDVQASDYHDDPPTAIHQTHKRACIAAIE